MAGDTCFEPLAATVPRPEMLTLVALVVLQDSVTDWPFWMVFELVVIEAVGRGGVLADPPPPQAFRVISRAAAQVRTTQNANPLVAVIISPVKRRQWIANTLNPARFISTRTTADSTWKSKKRLPTRLHREGLRRAGWLTAQFR